jgi:aspartate/methionine/tyrosine aminotransferase
MPARPNRLTEVPGFGIDRVAEAAGADPEILRLENLDTDLPVPEGVVEATRAAVGVDEYNSWLPFTGRDDLKELIARHMTARSGVEHEAGQVVITLGEGDGMIDALHATCDIGDEVLVTDPTYAGMINRVRLAGGVPRLVPLVQGIGEWRLDLDALGAAVTPRTRVVFLMNPSMPSGAVLDRTEWEAVAELCRTHDCWLLYNAAMERILFDGRGAIHPAGLAGMGERTIVVGSVSKEYRMIGWRVGWVAGPEAIMADIARVHLYNVVSPTGIAQSGAAAALREPPTDVAAAVAEWERRRDAVLLSLSGFPLMRPAGGWSMLLDVRAMGHDSFTASRLLLEHGRVAATPMRDWGEVNGDRFVRLVFSNEPAARLAELGDRLRRAF